MQNKQRVSIINKGTLIPEDFTSTIFTKFSQADSSDSRAKGGSGLGLSICKGIIEKHHGTIGFKNLPNGVDFYFDLPDSLETGE